MKNKILLAGLLVLTVLIALSVAHATVYVDKSGSLLDIGELQNGTEDNMIDYDVNNEYIKCNFLRETSEWNAWLYPLGTQLGKDDSFYARIDFTTPSSLSASNPLAGFGFFNRDTGLSANSVRYVTYRNTNDYIQYSASNGTSKSLESGFPLLTNTDYYIEIIHDAANDNATAKLYFANGTLVITRFVGTGGWAINVTHIGLSSWIGGTGNYADWIITKIKANSGTSEETPTETCSDSTQNQDETDIDCGGLICNACSLGLDCSNNYDCISGVCSGGTCSSATQQMDKRTSSFEDDVVEKAPSAGMEIDADGKISSKFIRNNTWQAIMYPLGTTFTQDDDFYAKFEFTTPASLSFSGQPFAVFGFFNSAGDNPFVNALNVAVFQATNEGSREIYAWVYDSTGSGTTGSAPYALINGTSYYFEMTHDTRANSLVGVLYFSNGTLVKKAYVSTDGKTFSLTHVGVSNYKHTTVGAFSNAFKITKIKVNSGDIVVPTSSIQSQSGLSFERVSDGENVAGYGQTGSSVDVYINNTTAGKPVGIITVDFNSAGEDYVTLPDLVTGRTDNTTLMHNSSGPWPSEIIRSILVEKVEGYYPFHCPLASTLDDVNLTCNNIDLTPEYTEVSIGGITYFKMSNQGGGNGGDPPAQGVPEFSDLGWILAAVLGAGGFMLVRRKKAF